MKPSAPPRCRHFCLNPGATQTPAPVSAGSCPARESCIVLRVVFPAAQPQVTLRSSASSALTAPQPRLPGLSLGFVGPWNAPPFPETPVCGSAVTSPCPPAGSVPGSRPACGVTSRRRPLLTCLVSRALRHSRLVPGFPTPPCKPSPLLPSDPELHAFSQLRARDVVLGEGALGSPQVHCSRICGPRWALTVLGTHVM